MESLGALVFIVLALFQGAYATVPTAITSTGAIDNGAKDQTVTISATGPTNIYCTITGGADQASASISPTTAATGATTCTLTISATTSYVTKTSYVVIFSVFDAATPADTASQTITVSVNKNAYCSSTFQACLASSAGAGTDVVTVSAVTAVASDTVTYTITGGDTNNVFSITSGLIEIATGKTLPSNTALMTLTVTADPADGTSTNGQCTAYVGIGSWCMSGVASLAAPMTLVLAAILAFITQRL